MAFCSNCGSEASGRFCSSCGAPLEQEGIVKGQIEELSDGAAQLYAIRACLSVAQSQCELAQKEEQSSHAQIDEIENQIQDLQLEIDKASEEYRNKQQEYFDRVERTKSVIATLKESAKKMISRLALVAIGFWFFVSMVTIFSLVIQIEDPEDGLWFWILYLLVCQTVTGYFVVRLIFARTIARIKVRREVKHLSHIEEEWIQQEAILKEKNREIVESLQKRIQALQEEQKLIEKELQKKKKSVSEVVSFLSQMIKEEFEWCLSERDFCHLDSLIYYLKTHRASNLQQALLLINTKKLGIVKAHQEVKNMPIDMEEIYAELDHVSTRFMQRLEQECATDKEREIMIMSIMQLVATDALIDYLNNGMKMSSNAMVNKIKFF